MSRGQSSCTLSPKKNKIFVYSFKYPNKESGKTLKNEAAEPYLEACQISLMEPFYENTNNQKLHHRCLMWF